MMLSSLILSTKTIGSSTVRIVDTRRRLFLPTTSTASSFSTKRKFAANDPQAPFGMTKKSIYQLKNDIVHSHQEFWDDLKRTYLASTDDHSIQFRKVIRKVFAQESRRDSIKRFGLWATAKHMLLGSPIYTRTEEDGMKEATDQFLAANFIWVYESVAKKCLYEFPSIYSHVLDEIFNKKLFKGSKNKSNYLLESGAISPQLAQVLRTRLDALAKEGIDTSVKVRQEASPPIVLGYASRLPLVVMQKDAAVLPKKLSLLHVPVGVVPWRNLPDEQETSFYDSACVHVLIHTHETYTFAQQTRNSSRKQAKPAKLNMPRILTLVGHFDLPNLDPSKDSVEKLKHELDLAAFEDRELDLFTHNPARFRERYPDGCDINANLGIQWQLVDIDFLVARSRGWVATNKMGSVIKVNNRICYQPPQGHLDFDKDDMSDEGPRRPISGLVILFELLKFFFLSALVLFILFIDDLPTLVKAIMLYNGWSEEDTERLVPRLFPRKASRAHFMIQRKIDEASSEAEVAAAPDDEPVEAEE